MTTVIFDLGGVLIDWDPRYLYRSMLPSDDAIDAFLHEIGFGAWNLALDAGADWDEAVETLATRHPEHRELIEAFRDRWEETLGHEIPETVDILREVGDLGLRRYALSNWSSRTFEVAKRRFALLGWFDGIVISGDVRAVKPERQMFEALLERYAIEPSASVFIDDREANVRAAEAVGIRGIRFTDSRELRRRLRAWGVAVSEAGA